MRVLITGSARGIGRAAALKYLSLGHEVHGIDVEPSSIDHPLYRHYAADVRNAGALPDVDGVEILFNNAGVQQGEDDIATNLVGAIKHSTRIRGNIRLALGSVYNQGIDP